MPPAYSLQSPVSSLQPDKARDPPEPDEPIIEPWLDDPIPDYDHELVFAQN